jgi:stage II sporulation protein D
MLVLALALLVRVEVLGLLHPHVATISTPKGELRVRAIGDTVHEGVGPPLPFLKLPASARKPLAIKVDKLPTRAFAGTLEIRAQAGELHFFNEVPLEEYVASVVGAEMPGAPIEAQKSLAVVARSFASQSSPAAAPLCDTTLCQLYGGTATATKSARAAASATQDLVLLLPGGSVAPALHHAACGGRTSTAREVWPGASDEDELASATVEDKLPDGTPACAPNRGDPPLAWVATLDDATVAKALGTALPLVLKIDRGPDGRVKALAANGMKPLGADELHLALGRSLGWNRIRSSRIYWAENSHDHSAQHAHPEGSDSPARFAVRGSGFGHGVGLCQRGAVRWSRAGEGFRHILSRYFPKLVVGRLPITRDPR